MSERITLGQVPEVEKSESKFVIRVARNDRGTVTWRDGVLVDLTMQMLHEEIQEVLFLVDCRIGLDKHFDREGVEDGFGITFNPTRGVSVNEEVAAEFLLALLQQRLAVQRVSDSVELSLVTPETPQQ